MRKNNFCHLVTIEWFSKQILVNFVFFKLSWTISLIVTWLKSPFYSWQAIWARTCVRERFKNFKNYTELYEKPLKRDWVARVIFLTNPANFRQPLQSLLFRYTTQHLQMTYFNMLFQFLLTKFSKSKLFSCLQKVDLVTNYCKKAYWKAIIREI